MDAFNPPTIGTPVEVVPWNTGDYDIDPMYPNAHGCPRLAQLEQEALSHDQQFLQWKAAPAQVDTVATMNSIFTDKRGTSGEVDPFAAFDCLMTSRCTDQPLPPQMTEDLYAASINQAEYPLYRQYAYNQCAYSRLAMAPLFADVRRFIHAATSATTSPEEVVPQFVLFAGHDTTIMPFLAALGSRDMFPDTPWVWDGTWCPYASMILLEVWEVDSAQGGNDHGGGNGNGGGHGNGGGGGNGSGNGNGGSHGNGGGRGYAVRLLFQGKAVSVPGCSAALCPVEEFLDLTSFAADAHERRVDQCRLIPLEESSDPVEYNPFDSPGTDAFVMVGAGAVLGVVFGGLVVLLLTGNRICCCRGGLCGSIGNFCSLCRGKQGCCPPPPPSLPPSFHYPPPFYSSLCRVVSTRPLC
jgi:uncharacterized membrane protein YgcG